MTKLTVMIGVPASGKSYWAKYIADEKDSILIEADDVRKEVFGNRQTKEAHIEVFAYCHRLIKDSLSDGKDVVFDATNLSHKHRKRFIDIAKTCGADVSAVLVASPWHECLDSNESRERVVPTDVMEGMRKNFVPPFMAEGWDNISIIWNIREVIGFSERFRIADLFRVMDDFNQDNRHHSLTLGSHVRAARDAGKEHSNLLRVAGMFHDIGKLWTKKFETFKGEPTEDAHYLSHENVGAYMALFYLKAEGYSDDFILDVVNLIVFHMRLYFVQSEKALRRLVELVGQDAFENLERLHDADVAAH